MQKQRYIEFKKQRELGEILSDSLAFIRSEFKPFFGTILKIVGPYILVMLISMGFYLYTVGDLFNIGTGGDSFNGFSTGIMIIAILALFVSAIASYVLTQGTVLHYIKSYIETQGNPIFEDIRASVYGSFWSFLGLGFLVGLSIGAGFIFCLIPGIYLAVPLAMAIPILVFLKKDVMDSYQYSFTLIKDNWWITFATLIIVYIIVAVASAAFNLPAIIYMWAKMGVLSGELNAENFNLFNDPVYLFLNLFKTLVQYLMNIVLLVTIAFIFFNLNEKKNFTGTYERIGNLGKSEED